MRRKNQLRKIDNKKIKEAAQGAANLYEQDLPIMKLRH